MISLVKDKKVKEFGDFQTPRELAYEVCFLLSRLKISPQTIIEPTCGLGNFIAASRKIFHSAKIYGFEVSPKYVGQAQDKFADDENISIFKADFFRTDWKELIESFEKPILVLGNPPWVTNSQLSVLESSNLPIKENFQHLSGLDAKTGKSNFDISEWMLINLLKSLDRQKAQLAMIVKTSVARKVLTYAWKNGIRLSTSTIYEIETSRYFNASVDSCLLFCDFFGAKQTFTSKVFKTITHTKHSQIIGFKEGELLASMDCYEKWKYLNGGSKNKWRSGVKHDCSKVMELKKNGNKYENGLGEIIELEEEFVYPLLKSSDIANGNLEPRRFVLVTQKGVKDDTEKISEIAPKTWRYLISHAKYLDNRGSSIYKKRPRFAVFGVGDYSFAPWKVAVSGFYKKINFNLIGNYKNKPIVLDDTCYFISFDSKVEAEKICNLLNSDIAREFFQSFIFFNAKRPVTVEILQKLNLEKLAQFTEKVQLNGFEEAYDLMVNKFEKISKDESFQKSFDFVNR